MPGGTTSTASTECGVSKRRKSRRLLFRCLDELDDRDLFKRPFRTQLSSFLQVFHGLLDTVDGRNLANQVVDSLSYYLQGFIYIPGGAGFLPSTVCYYPWTLDGEVIMLLKSRGGTLPPTMVQREKILPPRYTLVD